MNKKEVKKAPALRFKGFTNDWEQRKLKDCLEINSGRDYKHLHSGNIPVFGTGGYMLSVDEALSYKNAIGIGRKGTIDKPQLLIAPFWTVDTLFFLTPENDTDLYFLFYFFQKVNWKKYDESTGLPSLSKKTISTIKIKTPSKNEQIKIGTLIQKVNNLISLQQRKLKLLKEIRKGIVENIRDNNFEYKEQKNDFKDVKIKDMFKITRGKVLPKEKISSNKISPNIYPVFSSQTLNNGLLGFYKDYLFQNAITWTTDGANAGTVNFRNEKFYSTNVNGVLLQKKIKPDLLTADLLNLVAFKYVSKVGNPKLMNNTMANIRIKIPSNTNARIFYSKILNKCDTKIDFINKKIDYLTTFKRFLLQNMFI